MNKVYGMAKGALLPMLMAVVLLFAGCGGEADHTATDITRLTLDNGMDVVLKENHASPMITCMLFVKAGSKYENDYNNGATHFLEHLLFNGTANQTQEQLQTGIERLGGYLNAFTRKEFTAYLVLLPKEYIEYGMATQADMLFNSVFPEERFPKERGIVIEEIKMGNDAATAAAESFFEQKALVGTPYARPIIGYESIIANIPREAIIDYYKRFYAPNNIMALIIGDFESAEMTATVKRVFGGFPSVQLPPAPEIAYKKLDTVAVYQTTAPVKSTHVNLSIEGPHFSDSAYPAFVLLEDYLNDREHSPLMQPLKTGSRPLASEVSAYVQTTEEFTRLNIEIISQRNDRTDSILAVCDDVLKRLSWRAPSEELVHGYQVSRRCQDIFLSERLHYYGFIIAPLLAVTGWDYFSTFSDRIDSVTAADITEASRRFLDNPAYIATVVTPGSASEFAAGPSAEEVIAYYQQIEIPAHELAENKDFALPAVSHTSPAVAETHNATYLREVLDNGLTVIVKSNPDSRVLALNVLGKNRSATEPEGRDGITDFVNRMITKGTTSRSARQLSTALGAIGAKVTLTDNAWISHDDRYTTRQFSFMKFETIDEFTEPGIALFTDMIANPAFDSAAFAEVHNEMFGLIGRRAASPYQAARKEFYETLFAETPYASTIEGTYRSLNAITLDDVKAHHHRVYSPENMIVSVCSNQDASFIMRLIKETLGSMPATGFTPVEPTAPSPPRGIKTAHEQMEKEQVQIYLGGLLPACGTPDATALKVAGEVLSNRLAANLREKQGLAYSVGASATLDRHFGWLICSMGTSAENYERARDGIIAEIERLKTEPPTEQELSDAVNGIWGSFLSANLARINQAYYLGVYEYLGLGYNYLESYINAIRAVTPQQVSDAAQKHFDTKNYVLATAGNI
ncbi:MAG: insulinase family protein [candidate division Zixibacteria bacterium]|nr:insulinase family protein [candidate division Zixibacteria bacterium]